MSCVLCTYVIYPNLQQKKTQISKGYRNNTYTYIQNLVRYVRYICSKFEAIHIHNIHTKNAKSKHDNWIIGVIVPLYMFLYVQQNPLIFQQKLFSYKDRIFNEILLYISFVLWNLTKRSNPRTVTLINQQFLAPKYMGTPATNRQST